MFGIEEISKFKTSDGVEFEDEETAMAHELAIKNIQPNDLIVKDKFGSDIELKELWWRVDLAHYVEAHSEAALEFFNEAALAAGTLPLERGLGIYRYDDYSDSWVIPQDDILRLWEQWSIYNDKINFTYYS